MVLTLCLFLVSGLTATAQIPQGSEFRADTLGADFGFLFATPRSATMAPDGRFVLAWTTRRVGPDGGDIAARRFTAAGVAIGAEFIVNTYTTALQYNEAIASDDAGNFVVVWSSEGQDGSGQGVFGQRFDAAGARLGAEFQVNETTVNTQWRPSVAMRFDGGFVVAWSATEVFARRYNPSGLPASGEFQVSTSTAGTAYPSVDLDGAGNFVVVWESGPVSQPSVRGQLFTGAGVPQGPELMVGASARVERPRVARGRDGSFVVAWWGAGILARRFDPTGAPLGAQFLVNVFPAGLQALPDVDVDTDGDFVVAWTNEDQDGSASGVFARRFDRAGIGGAEFRVNTYTTGNQAIPSVASDAAGNFVIAWHSYQNAAIGVFAQRYAGGLAATALSIDTIAGPTSDGNGVLEAGETVDVAPSWLNANFAAQTFSGTASGFTGPGAPGDPIYTITDGAASYGTVASGATASCAVTSDCYALGITVPTSRPAPHWDATFHEEISPANLGAAKNWTLHVGDSFSDVPRTSPFYRFVETILHHDVTGGCTATTYCPASPTAREQMAVFVLVAKESSGYVPPACTTPVFGDVPATSPFCRWIEELSRRGVVSGCGGGNYCPTTAVSRQEMAVFVLATKEPGVVPPACGTPSRFTDVPASSPFCRWIEELARRGVVSGCGGGAYCPTSHVTREQMSVFLSGTFGLVLYGA